LIPEQSPVFNTRYTLRYSVPITLYVVTWSRLSWERGKHDIFFKRIYAVICPDISNEVACLWCIRTPSGTHWPVQVGCVHVPWGDYETTRFQKDGEHWHRVDGFSFSVFHSGICTFVLVEVEDCVWTKRYGGHHGIILRAIFMGLYMSDMSIRKSSVIKSSTMMPCPGLYYWKGWFELEQYFEFRLLRSEWHDLVVDGEIEQKPLFP